jgi:hypothetical protein
MAGFSGSMTSQIIPVDPFDFIIFGGTGDLAERKLLPALYQRQMAGQFSEPHPHHRRITFRTFG